MFELSFQEDPLNMPVEGFQAQESRQLERHEKSGYSECSSSCDQISVVTSLVEGEQIVVQNTVVHSSGPLESGLSAEQVDFQRSVEGQLELINSEGLNMCSYANSLGNQLTAGTSYGSEETAGEGAAYSDCFLDYQGQVIQDKRVISDAGKRSSDGSFNSTPLESKSYLMQTQSSSEQHLSNRTQSGALYDTNIASTCTYTEYSQSYYGNGFKTKSSGKYDRELIVKLQKKHLQELGVLEHEISVKDKNLKEVVQEMNDWKVRVQETVSAACNQLDDLNGQIEQKDKQIQALEANKNTKAQSRGANTKQRTKFRPIKALFGLAFKIAKTGVFLGGLYYASRQEQVQKVLDPIADKVEYQVISAKDKVKKKLIQTGKFKFLE